jgi:PAS domain-containing protein
MDQEISFELLKQRVRDLENETARLKRARKKTYLMQQCLDGAGDVIFWIDKDANIVYVNKAIQRNFGFSRQELVS